jgi:putative tricarboxylic transport membrane protein
MLVKPSMLRKARRPFSVTNDLIAGAFFVLVGVTLAVLSRDLSLGTNTQPGPGYLPMALGVLLSLLGAIICGRDLMHSSKSETATWPVFRPFLAVLGIFVFAGLIETLGFIISAALLIVLGLAACGRSRAIELVVLTVVLVGLNILIFIVGLGQRIPLLP